MSRWAGNPQCPQTKWCALCHQRWAGTPDSLTTEVVRPMSSTAALAGTRQRHSWVIIAVIGALAVCAGMVVPQMLPTDAAVSAPPSSAESAKKPELAYTPPAWPEAPDSKAMIIRLVLGTAIVLGLCAATLLLSKRWLRAGSPKN